MVDSTRAGSLVTASEPMPLEPLTMTGFAERSRSGTKACVTRTTPATLVSITRRTSAAVTSGAGIMPPEIPALLMRTSRPPASATAAAAPARRGRRFGDARVVGHVEGDEARAQRVGGLAAALGVAGRGPDVVA